MNVALVLSGGTGTRLGGDIPKQYRMAGDREILFYCLKTLSDCPQIDGIQIVAHPSWQDWIMERLERYGLSEKMKGFSVPGETRQMSIVNGLGDILKYAAETDAVLIHDAARPNLTKKMVEACFAALPGHDGVIPVLPMKDTVYLSEDGQRITSLLNRQQVVSGQAPELFLLGRYLRANERLFPKKILEINGSTEPAVLAGLDVAVIPGEESNYKITTKADLERFVSDMEG